VCAADRGAHVSQALEAEGALKVVMLHWTSRKNKEKE